MFTRIMTTIILALTVAGCAVGNTYDLSQGAAPVSQASQSLGIAVADMRSYVVSGDKAPTFIGLQRGGFGNPFNVNTSSGRPLAADVSTLLVNSYGSSGVDVKPLASATGPADPAALSAQAAGQGAQRLLLLEMREWKTDVFAQVTVTWDLTARVFDTSGQELANEKTNGVQGTGSAGIGEDANGQIADAALKRRLGELLSRPAIATALN